MEYSKQTCDFTFYCVEIILFKSIGTYGAGDLDGNILVAYPVNTDLVSLAHKQILSLTKARVENTKFLEQK